MPEPRDDPNPAAAPDDDTPPEDTRTVGELLAGAIPNQPIPQPGFATFADEPGELPDPTLSPADPRQPLNAAEIESQEVIAINEARQRIHQQQRARHGLEPTAAPPAIDGEILAPLPHAEYEARIQIVEAWVYPGTLVNAPAWVDRNWAGYGDDDHVRGIPAGPCLRVPNAADPHHELVVLARVGDIVARQAVTLAPGNVELRTEVWARDHFERMFVARPPSSRQDGPARSAIQGMPLTGPAVRSMPAAKPTPAPSSGRVSSQQDRGSDSPTQPKRARRR